MTPVPRDYQRRAISACYAFTSPVISIKCPTCRVLSEVVLDPETPETRRAAVDWLTAWADEHERATGHPRGPYVEQR